jgi:pimeloyl-ACP methyl ester carboxylesterase
MPKIAANGIELEYETFGDKGNPPLVLIMGLGAQMILWDEAFCEDLAARGFYVVRFDNRDVGQSTWLRDHGMPNLPMVLMAAMTGGKVEAPYTLSDMAADTVALMDGLGIASAHIVGASMGGMIAQTLAIEHPGRVRSLTSIMSTTGDPTLPQASPEVMAILMTPPSPDREGNIERGLKVFRTIGSPGFPFDEERVRNFAGRSFDRGFHPEGVARQICAIFASGNRKPLLANVKCPTLVLHGKEDVLVRFEGGADTAGAIPGAKLVAIDGMGHDLPKAVWPIIIDGICEVAARA